MNETDGERLERCRRGDQAAWRELVALHTRRVFALAYRFGLFLLVAWRVGRGGCAGGGGAA